jgi:hypothetical protein
MQKYDKGMMVAGEQEVDLPVGVLKSGIYYFNIYLNDEMIYYGKITVTK